MLLWRCPILLAGVLCVLTSCGNGQSLLWVAPSSSPQKPDDARPTDNSVFDGAKATLAAGRNETEGLVLRTAGRGGPVTVTDLTSDEGAVIAASAIETFELAQAARRHLDAVVPRKPLTLPDRGAALLRIHVPADARPGLYRGTIRVGADRLPLELTVWGHVLPRNVTFFRNSPRWSSWTPNEAAGLGGAKAELDALWRGRLTPAHAFWGKRPWWHFRTRLEKVSAADHWPGTDELYQHYFEHGGMQIDIDWHYASPHGIRLVDPTRDPANAIRYFRIVHGHFERKFKAGDRLFVQSRADEPNLGQGKAGRQHCEYAQAIAWSKAIRAGVPQLKILMAEHPAPQLLRWVDIFNSPWTHARGPDARELAALGKRLLWYSADIKRPADLHLMRVTYWRAFANGLHGAWTWERYGYMKPNGANYRDACIYEPGAVGGVPKTTAVASLKLEAAGEGHDDFETLRLLERWAGDPFVALSFAQHSLTRRGPTTSPNATDLGPDDFIPLGRTLAFLLARKHVKTFTFKNSGDFARLDGIELIPGDTGFARLQPAKTTPFTSIRAFGNAKTSVANGIVEVEMIGGTKMTGVDFAGPRVAPAREVRFDIHVTPNPDVRDGLANMGLFDVFLRIDGRYGTGVNWKTGEYNRTLGHWSDSGSFPGKWRSVRCVLAHTIGAPRGAASVGIAIGRAGYYDTNDPLPGQRYELRIRSVRVTSLAHKRRGVIETTPIHLGDGPAHLWWVTDWKPLPATSVTIEVRRGTGDFQRVAPLPGLVGVARLPGGAGPATIRLTLTGGSGSPCIHAVGLLAD